MCGWRVGEESGGGDSVSEEGDLENLGDGDVGELMMDVGWYF